MRNISSSIVYSTKGVFYVIIDTFQGRDNNPFSLICNIYVYIYSTLRFKERGTWNIHQNGRCTDQ